MKRIIAIATLAALTLGIAANQASAVGGFCRGVQGAASVCQR
ncbi:MAG TPA: hypothetical protein V6C65_19690 [Allocoleopsis sp.]